MNHTQRAAKKTLGRRIDDATRAWEILGEGVVFAPLTNTIVQAGSSSGGQKVVDGWFEPRGAAQQDLCIARFENLGTQRGEDPLAWIGRVGDAVNILAGLDIHKTEVMSRRQIARHLTNEHRTECRPLLRVCDHPRNELEKSFGTGLTKSKLQSQ